MRAAKKEPPHSAAAPCFFCECNHIHDLIKYMVSDDNPIDTAGSAEMRHGTHVSLAVQRRLSRLDAAGFGTRRHDCRHPPGSCRPELSRSGDDRLDGSRISPASDTVHDHRAHRKLPFVGLVACFGLDQGFEVLFSFSSSAFLAASSA